MELCSNHECPIRHLCLRSGQPLSDEDAYSYFRPTDEGECKYLISLYETIYTNEHKENSNSSEQYYSKGLLRLIIMVQKTWKRYNFSGWGTIRSLRGI